MPASSLSSVLLPDAGGPSSSVKRPGASALLRSLRMTSRFFSERSRPSRRKPHCAAGPSRVSSDRAQQGRWQALGTTQHCPPDLVTYRHTGATRAGAHVCREAWQARQALGLCNFMLCLTRAGWFAPQGCAQAGARPRGGAPPRCCAACCTGRAGCGWSPGTPPSRSARPALSAASAAAELNLIGG